jgi:hypothetical protein
MKAAPVLVCEATRTSSPCSSPSAFAVAIRSRAASKRPCIASSCARVSRTASSSLRFPTARERTSSTCRSASTAGIGP